MRNMILVLTLTLFVLASCNQEKANIESNRFDEILQTDYPEHFPDETVDAVILREIIAEYVLKQDASDLTSYIKVILQEELYPKDSILYNRISNKIDSDQTIIEDCEYLNKVLSCKELIQSRHFNIYNLNSKVNAEEIELYDNQYDELMQVFDNADTARLNLVLDTNLNYWRAFPLWDIKYGLLQRYINGNPHELVHHFFTKYSDVPFFQEPMAFLYGDYGNDSAKFYNKFTSLNEELTNAEYVLAKEVWHFPAIVIMEKYDKLSFWLFTSTLMQKYGIEKFIEFASLTTWDKNNEDFANNFKIVYGLPLNKFEQEFIIKKLKS